MSEVFDFLTFPLKGSRLIEASAGTGKTFSLALLYTRLILGHGKALEPALKSTLEPEYQDQYSGFTRALTPKEILVVTFTEAAAEELRDRIRARLVEAVDVFQQPTLGDCDHEPLQRLKADFPPEQWPGCAWRLKIAAESMDEASISTIHSWCNRMLVEHAFDTRGLFNRELVTDQSELLAEVVKDYWRKHFYRLEESDVALVQAHFNAPANLQASLNNLIQSQHDGISYGGQPLKITSFDEVVGLLHAEQEKKERLTKRETAAKQAWLEDWEAICDYLNSIRERLNGTRHGSTRPETFKALLDEIYIWAKGSRSDNDSGDSGENKAPSKLKNFATGAFTFKKNKEIELEAFRAFDATNELFYGTDDDLYGEAKSNLDLPLKAVLQAHAYQWVKTEFAARMQQRAEMSFDDLLTQLWRALNDGDQGRHLAKALVNSFPVALIDEFQDTDPIQYGIFDAIYQVEQNNPASALIMIGDPKQAIYSFRGADIHTYLAARSATGHRQYTLAKNFRSTEGIVKACNHLFQHGEQHPRGAFRFKPETGENPIPYVEVEAAGRQDQFLVQGQPVAPLTLFPVYSLSSSPTSSPEFSPASSSEDDDSGSSLIAQTAYREQVAEIAATQIVTWLNDGQHQQAGFGANGQLETALQPKDIAVLVRTGKEAKLVRDALHRRQVASVYLSDRESVFASQEAEDLLIWLKACAEPSNEQKVRGALGTNTLDLPLEQLAHWREDELGWEAQMLTFISLRQVWYQQGILALVRELLERYQLPARLLASPDGERALTNLLHLAEWLEHAAVELRGDQALIRHFSEQIAAHDEQQILRLESDADLVQVITIHKSKGLEYPLVMLPFMGSWKVVDGKTSIVNWLSGQHHFKEISDNKVFGEAWALADQERLSEDMRLLYVALTRASHLLWLGVGALKEGNSKTPNVERSAMGYLLNGGEKIKEADQVLEAYQALAKGCDQITWLEHPPAITDDCYQPAQLSTLTDARKTEGLGRLNDWWIASYSSIKFGKLSQPAGYAAALDQQSGRLDQGSEGFDQRNEELGQRNEELDQDEVETAFEVTASEMTDEPKETPILPVDEERFMHQFPGGAEWGTFLHHVIEWSAEQRSVLNVGSKQPLKGFNAVYQDDNLRNDHIYRLCQLRNIGHHAKGLSQWLKDFMSMTWQFSHYMDRSDGDQAVPKSLCLADLSTKQMMVEMEFLFSSQNVPSHHLDRLVREMTLDQAPRPMAQPNRLNGMLKGFIDLVVEYQGRYYVVDWKSNKLGKDDSDYTVEKMQEAILKKRYDLQYVLYTLALHRQLKARLPDYDYETHIGGAVYVFLRGWKSEGQGLFYDRPSKALIEQLDRLFAGATDAHKGYGRDLDSKGASL